MESIIRTAEKIKNMEIRGAGKIARAVADALKVHAQSIDIDSPNEFDTEMKRSAQILLKTRPTAVSLPNAIRFVMRYQGNTVEEMRNSLVHLAEQFIERSEKAVKQIGSVGAKRVRDGDVIMTHCNPTAAIAIIATAFNQGNARTYHDSAAKRCRHTHNACR